MNILQKVNQNIMNHSAVNENECERLTSVQVCVKLDEDGR